MATSAIQLYLHVGRHKVVWLEQHQRLSIDLLHAELLDVVRAAGQVLDEVAHLVATRNYAFVFKRKKSLERPHLCYRPLERVVLQDGG